MKKLQSIILILCASFTSVSCIFMGPSIRGEGEVTQDKRALSGYDKVMVSRGLEVYLVPDSVEYVTVEADENLHRVILTEVDGETLEVSTDHFIRSARSKKVYVHFKHLNGVKSTSGSFVRSEGTVTGKKLTVSASSGSRQELNVSCGSFEGRCSSGAQVSLNGTAREARLMAASGAHLKAGGFVSAGCYAKASSGAHIRTGVKTALDAEASSGGHIYFSGNPGTRSLDSSSGGQIIEE